MNAPTSKPRRVVLAVAAVLLAVFGAVVAGLSWQLRGQLRDEVLRREAEAIHGVAQLQLSAAEMQMPNLDGIDPSEDLFAAVLESSRLRGVLAVQLFDADGRLRATLPETGGAPTRWWPARPAFPLARFEPKGALEKVYALPTETGEATRAPLLEVIVPLRANAQAFLGSARYWLDGAHTAAEFRRMDRRLTLQAGIAFVAAALALAGVLGWALNRLGEANRRLVAQSADLARANQELDFAARTAAIGAITAHLIHGLKSPLTGLEGFVSENATTEDPARGEAWRAAADTTRRLQSLVNEVVHVLREESTAGDDYVVPLRELLEAAHQRAAPAAANAGVALHAVLASDAEMRARTANLAGLVLANLLANAIEATPRCGQIKVTAGANENLIEFFVSDTGPGIPEALRPNLFRPLRSPKAGGGGVGLAISRQLARHAGGDLEMIRSDAAGTVFRLRVPAVGAQSVGR